MGRYSGANAVHRAERVAELERRTQTRVGLLMHFEEEEPMLDPFHDFGEPPEPDAMTSVADIAATFPSITEQFAPQTEPSAQNSQLEALSRPVGASADAAAQTVVRFPVVVSGSPGVDLAALLDPARRVAEIIEAIQPVLVPPPTVRELEALVARANALDVTDAASYIVGCELYDLLAANEKGIEETIGPIVGFFHRPWKAMCEFRAKFAPPVLAAKRRLSDVCGAWKQVADAKALQEQKLAEETAAADERARLGAVAAEARATGQLEVAETATQLAAEVQTPVVPVRPSVPTGSYGGGGGLGPKGRKKWVAEILDLDKVYKGIADGTIPKSAAPLDMAWWDSQAHDLKQELEARYPGAKAVEKNGLTASGRR